MGIFFSSLFFARGLDHNVTIEGNSNLRDFDHRGENFLTAKSDGTSQGPRIKSAVLASTPSGSTVMWNLPHHTLGRIKGGERAFQRGDSITLNGQLKETIQSWELLPKNHMDFREISSPIAS